MFFCCYTGDYPNRQSLEGVYFDYVALKNMRYFFCRAGQKSYNFFIVDVVTEWLL